MKRRLFSKLKDYNYILDKVLEEKNFSEDAKNLLLNMIYKIEVSYKDYAQIKVVYMKQNTFIDNIIKIISDRCKYLFLVDPKYAEVRELKEKNVLALTDEREQRIYAYPTELAILYGLIDINPKYYYIPKKYNYLKKQLQRALVHGTVLDSTEVIRNFNGWSWDVAEDAGIDTVSNMIYQAIRILIDEDFLRMWENDTSAKIDFISEMRKELEEYYGAENSKSFYIAMAKLIIANSKKEDKDNIKKEIKNVYEAYDNMKNEEDYIGRLTKEKNQLNNVITRYNDILNNDEKLIIEFKRRNNRLPDSQKIISINNFKEKIRIERDQSVYRIREIEELLRPENYDKIKDELYEKIQIFAVSHEKKTIRDYEIVFLQQAIKCFAANLDKISSKEEIFDIVYKMRYFRKIRVTPHEKIEDIPELWNEIRKIMKFIITKGCQGKVFNVFCNDVEGNYNIFDVALDTAIPNYEDIDISVKMNGNLVEITVYDNEVVDKQQVIEVNFKPKDLSIRQGRKIPMVRG